MKSLINYFQTKLQGRLILVFLPLFIIPFAVLIFFGSNVFSDILIENAREQEEALLNEHIREMDLFLETTFDDINYLATSSQVRDYAFVSATENEEIVGAVAERLEADFLAFATARHIYSHVTLIDADGQELIRVDFDGTSAVAADELQNQADSIYFSEISRLNDGEVYISPMILAREGNPPELQLTEEGSIIPTMHYGSPIYVNGNLVAVVVLDVYAQEMLDVITPANDFEETFLLNPDGYILFDTGLEEEEEETEEEGEEASEFHVFGFEEGIEEVGGAAGFTIFDESDEFTEDEATRLLAATTRNGSFETQSKLLTYYTRYTPPGAPTGYYWIVGNSRDENVIFAQINTITQVATAVLLIVGGFITLFIIYMSRQLTRPILVLSDRARRLAAGERVFADEALQNRRDEIGLLNQSFVDMSAQIQQSFETLEDRVQSRTNDLATSAEIAAAANQVRDVDDLLSLTVNLIRDRFDFYYVQVYLIDQSKKWAVLHDGTGYVGRRLLAREHRLPLDGNSLVATAINSGEAVVVQDTKADKKFLPNELLPETRSEITVPLRTKSGVIGVLDIQHSEANIFDDTASALFQSMADQLAVTFENVELLNTTNKRAGELETVAKVSAEATTNLDLSDLLLNVSNLVRDSFGLYHAHIYLIDEDEGLLKLVAGAGEAGRVMVAEHRTIPLDAEQSVVASAARRNEGVIVNDVTENPNFLPHPALPDTKSEMAIPMAIGDDVIGVLDVQANITNRFTNEDVRIKSTLAGQLAVAIQNARSYERSRIRAIEIETVAQVGAEITQNQDVSDVLWHVADLTKANFDLYHAHIYLVNDAGDQLVLAAGAGEAGRTMVENGHAIPVDSETSVVARAFREHEGTIVNDVTNTPNFLPNPLLPDTKSEMAIPILLDEEAIGVLDVQGNVFNRFMEDDVRVKSTLAKQIASAIQNARSYEQVRSAESDIRQALSRVENMQFALDESAIVLIMDQNMKIEYMNDKALQLTGYTLEELTAQPMEVTEETDASQLKFFEALEAVSKGEVWKGELPGSHMDGTPYWTDTTVVPFLDENGNPYQYIFISYDITERKNQELQIARRAIEIETVAQVGAEISGSLDVNEVLWKVSNLTRDNFGLYHTHIYLLNDAGDELVLTAGAGEAGRTMVAENRRIALNAQQSIVAQAARTKEGVIVNDVTADPNFLPHPALPHTKAEMAIPILIQGQTLGVLDLQANITDRFDNEDKRVKTALAEQIAVAVQNARSFAQREKRALELETVAEVGAEVTTNLDIFALLQSVADLTKRRFGLYHAHIYLLNQETGELELTAGADEAGRKMVEAGHAISINREYSVVAKAARERQGVILNDVRENPMFLPNPLLPNTRSEMAIPMIVANTLIGVLDVQSDRTDRFNEEDVRVKSTLAAQVAVAIQNARSFQEVERQAEREREVAEQLREVDRLKSQFLANMSHELRTPLNSIIGYSEVLLDGVDGELNEDAEEDVQAIHDSGKHLLSIINEILDLAKIEAGEMKLDLKPVNLVEFTREIIRNGQVLVKDKPVVLEVVEEVDLPAAHADPVRLRQILWNLVSNAVKFTEEGSVRVHLNMNEDNMILLTVKDTGVGMTEEGLEVIFERFSQVDGSSTRRAGGTGLGLTITKQLIEMHGGQIEVNSVFGEGTTFWFTLPIHVTEAVSGD